MISRVGFSDSAIQCVILFVLFLAILSGCREVDAGDQERDYGSLDSALHYCTIWLNARDAYRVRPYLDSVYSGKTKIPDTYLVKKYHLLANLKMYHAKDMEGSKNYLDSTLSILNRNPAMADDRIRYYFLRGNLDLELRQYEHAFDAYYKGKQIIDSIGNKCRNKAYLNSIGHLLYKQERYSDALNYFRERQKLNSMCRSSLPSDNVFNELSDFNDMGLCYENTGRYSMACRYYDSGIRAYERFAQRYPDDTVSLSGTYAVVLGNMGSSLLKMGNSAGAKSYLKRSIDINYDPGKAIGDAILNKIKLAGVYQSANRMDSCSELIHAVEKDLEAYPDVLAYSRLANLKYRCSLKRGDYRQALLYSNLEKSLEDSLQYNGLVIDIRYDYSNQFEKLKKEVEIARLGKLNTTKTMYIGIVSCLLLGALGMEVLFTRKRVQKERFLNELLELNSKLNISNQKLHSSLTSLEESQEENSRIMRTLAHDLRNPIASMVAVLKLHRLQDITREELNKYLELIEKSSRHAMAFIDDILHSNELVGSEGMEKTDISVLLDTCLQLLKPQADKKNLTIHSHLFPVDVVLNQQKIWRVFNNLLVNAIKFTEAGKNIVMEMADQKDSVLITVRDEGIGIPETMKGKIFNLFLDQGRVGTQGEKSFGLGLAISKQIVEAHHGKIWFESDGQNGSSFHVLFPKAE